MSEKFRGESSQEGKEQEKIRLDVPRAIEGVVRDVEVWPMYSPEEYYVKGEDQRTKVLEALRNAVQLGDPKERLGAVQGAMSRAMDYAGGGPKVGWKLQGVTRIIGQLESAIGAELLPDTEWREDVKRLNLLKSEEARLSRIQNRKVYPETWENAPVATEEESALENRATISTELRELQEKLRALGERLMPNPDELKDLKNHLQVLDETLTEMMRSPEFGASTFSSNYSGGGLSRENVSFIDGSGFHFGSCFNPGYTGPFFGIDGKGPLLATYLQKVIERKGK